MKQVARVVNLGNPDLKQYIGQEVQLLDRQESVVPGKYIYLVQANDGQQMYIAEHRLDLLRDNNEQS